MVITGASSGIGAATALAFAKRGARLELAARRLDKLNEVAERCRHAGSPDVNVRQVDVAERAEARALVAGVLRSHERLDVLVNNAGVGWMGRLQHMPDKKVDELIAVNVKTVVTTTQAVLPWMLDRRRGVIINVASVAGFRASPYSAVYTATKHAVTRRSGRRAVPGRHQGSA